jgi:hypothetical protein
MWSCAAQHIPSGCALDSRGLRCESGGWASSSHIAGQESSVYTYPVSLLLSVYVIARPNVKGPTFGSLLPSLKFETLHVVPFIGRSFCTNHYVSFKQ